VQALFDDLSRASSRNSREDEFDRADCIVYDTDLSDKYDYGCDASDALSCLFGEIETDDFKSDTYLDIERFNKYINQNEDK